MELLKKFISETLISEKGPMVQFEVRAAEKVGYSQPEPIDVLNDLTEEGGYFIHFSNINKAGINPTNKFKTPTGFYTYPLDTETFQQVKDGSVPFAGDRPFLHVVKPVQGANVLVLQDITEEDLENIADGYEIEEAKQYSHVKTPGGLFWYVTMIQSNYEVGTWNKWFREQKIDGVVDYGDGIIHKNERRQAVFFKSSAFEHVITLHNPSRKMMVTKALARKKAFEDEWEKANAIAREYGFTDLHDMTLKVNDNDVIAYRLSKAGIYRLAQQPHLFSKPNKIGKAFYVEWELYCTGDDKLIKHLSQFEKPV